jgi:hypothetical protein
MSDQTEFATRIDLILLKEPIIRAMPLSFRVTNHFVDYCYNQSLEMIVDFIMALRWAAKRNNNIITKHAVLRAKQCINEDYEILQLDPQEGSNVNPKLDFKSFFDSFQGIKIANSTKKIIGDTIKQCVAAPINTAIQLHHKRRDHSMRVLITQAFRSLNPELFIAPNAKRDIASDLTHILDLVNLGVLDLRNQNKKIFSVETLIQLSRLPALTVGSIDVNEKLANIACQVVRENTNFWSSLISEFSWVFAQFVIYYCDLIAKTMKPGHRFVHSCNLALVIDKHPKIAEMFDLIDK